MQVLLSSVESMEASDAQVGALRTRLLDSVVQKREVLGEASTTELVQSDSGGERKRPKASLALSPICQPRAFDPVIYVVGVAGVARCSNCQKRGE